MNAPERGALPFLCVSDLLEAIADGRIVPRQVKTQQKRIPVDAVNPFDEVRRAAGLD